MLQDLPLVLLPDPLCSCVTVLLADPSWVSLQQTPVGSSGCASGRSSPAAGTGRPTTFHHAKLSIPLPSTCPTRASPKRLQPLLPWLPLWLLLQQLLLPGLSLPLMLPGMSPALPVLLMLPGLYLVLMLPGLSLALTPALMRVGLSLQTLPGLSLALRALLVLPRVSVALHVLLKLPGLLLSGPSLAPQVLLMQMLPGMSLLQEPGVLVPPPAECLALFGACLDAKCLLRALVARVAHRWIQHPSCILRC